jgi:hypothetical protein
MRDLERGVESLLFDVMLQNVRRHPYKGAWMFDLTPVCLTDSFIMQIWYRYSIVESREMLLLRDIDNKIAEGTTRIHDIVSRVSQ